MITFLKKESNKSSETFLKLYCNLKSLCYLEKNYLILYIKFNIFTIILDLGMSQLRLNENNGSYISLVVLNEMWI